MATVSHTPAPLYDEGPPTGEDRLALIERVAASEQFSRSARLRDFLLYVGRQSLKDGCPEIHEQEIGRKVFGRSVAYDRTQDNIVRVNATELRKRIDAYFAATGAAEPLVFEIPRGSYKPVFHRRQLTDIKNLAELAREGASVASVLPDAAAGTVQRSAWHRGHLWQAACLALAIACTVLVVQNRKMQRALQPWGSRPVVAEFWRGFLDPIQETDIVLPDDSASVVEDITHNPVALGDYLSRDFIRRVQSAPMSADRKEDVYQVFNHNLVTFGGVLAAQHILAQIPPNYPRHLTMTRYYTADEIKLHNVVLLGGKKSVPWDHLFDEQVNFVTDFDDVQSRQFVRNRSPKPGEQATYNVSEGPNNLVGYSAIAYLPNPSRTGHVIILAGTDSDATGAAAEFLTSEDQMEKLKATLHMDSFPYFEVLLKTSRLSGTSFNAELIAFRTYPGLR